MVVGHRTRDHGATGGIDRLVKVVGNAHVLVERVDVGADEKTETTKIRHGVVRQNLTAIEVHVVTAGIEYHLTLEVELEIQNDLAHWLFDPHSVASPKFACTAAQARNRFAPAKTVGFTKSNNANCTAAFASFGVELHGVGDTGSDHGSCASHARPKRSKNRYNRRVNAELKAQVEAWIADDPDPKTREELQALLNEGAEDELQDRFKGLLQFGTAGLRGLLGGGPHRMNRAVVIRATAGLCRYILETVPDAKERGICIGYDGRRMSTQFAKDAAAIVAGHGIKARVFDHVVPTPVLGYAVVRTNAAGGIMVTASHNPPDYNGYKVYWGNGAQIVPPHDTGIAAKIGAIESIADVAREDESALVETFGADIETEYLAKVKALAVHPETPRDLKIIYTAMHGVGGKHVLAALKDVGFTDVHIVKEQHEPDGEFPTVAFPNPEEDGAMDMALALAEKHNADLVVANDPDADRLATIVKHEGAYRPLSGNEIGCLFAHYLLDQGSGDKRVVLCSVVSSPMLLAIGEAHGVRAEQTLTGHKWIHNRAMDLEPEGYTFVFGFEEALGYAISPLVRDKDGVSAAAIMCDMAAWCRTQGRTLVDELELMWRRYGMFLSEQVSLVLPGAEGAKQIADGMRRARTDAPKSVGGLAVTATQDFETGLRTAAGQAQTKLSFPKANVVVYELEGGHRAMLRPSGTEPKLKLYFDVRVDIAEGESIGAARERGQTLLAGIVQDVRALLG